MPARHKQKGRLAIRRTAKSKSGRGKGLFLIIGVLVLLLTAAFVVFNLFFTTIGKMGRVSLVTQASGGDVTYTLFDFDEGTISNVKIDANTEVGVARSLGNWKLGVVGKLGENEKIGGVLLAETMTKSFRMPTYYWGDEIYGAFGQGEVASIAGAVFSFKKTNLSFADRVKIAMFSLGVKSGERQNILLAETKYLTRSKLEDGSLGYKVKGEPPFELKALLADGDISKEGLTIMLENGTGKDAASSFVGSVIAVMGGKLSSISKVDTNDSYCTVFGDSKQLTYQAIAKTFDCKKEGKLADYNFDIVVRIGKLFSLRY